MTVYFVQDGGPDRHIKIGYTGSNPHGRIAQLQTGNPHRLTLLVCIPDGTAADEKALHERFKDLREGGEWFRPDPRLLGFVEGLKYAYPDQPKDPGPGSPGTFEQDIGLTYPQAEALRAYINRSNFESVAQHNRGSTAPRSIWEAHGMLDAIHRFRAEASSDAYASGLAHAELIDFNIYEQAAKDFLAIVTKAVDD